MPEASVGTYSLVSVLRRAPHLHHRGQSVLAQYPVRCRFVLEASTM